ncbi:fas-binding factor 1 homolog isoform X1 [Tigriopus californicus]|uniref:fas-binding factor 1 homolog isoform X1 n=1 Tax=Tigriopus californicus TaxID=6832 RepID=UPI0027DA1A1F|nr:fas-binding factor 1 homolog isoform X1 [Tigriopus californicus]
MPKSDISDVDDDELAQMLEVSIALVYNYNTFFILYVNFQGIDFSDDERGKKQKSSKPSPQINQSKDNQLSKDTKPQEVPTQEFKSKSVRDIFGIEKKPKSQIQSEPKPSPTPVQTTTDEVKDRVPAMDRPTSGRRRNPNPVTFDDDVDDLLGDSGSKPAPPSKPSAGPKPSAKPSSSFMDDLFGKKEPSEKTTEPKKEFTLEPKYKTGLDASAKSKPKADTFELSTKAEPKLGSISDRGRRRREGAPSLAPTKPALDLDNDEALFKGTSWASKPPTTSATPLVQPPPSVQMPTQSAPVQSAPIQSAPMPIETQPLPWMQGNVTVPHVAPVPTVASVPQISEPNPVNQQVIQAYQHQLQQMQELERQQQEQFQRDLEEQRRLLQSKQNEHKAVLYQQRSMCQDQVKTLQEKQHTILKQQQAQTEILMKQIQAQMESELRIKNDLVRNQLQILSEIQIQHPEQVIDLAGLVQQIKDQKTVPGTHLESIVPVANRDQETKEELEHYFRRREDRIRQNHSEEVEDLEKRIGDLVVKSKEDHESFRTEIEVERQRRRQMLQDQTEEHQEAIQMLRSEYTIALDRIRDLKRFEVDAQKDAERSSKSVQILLNQVTSNTKDLDHLHDKVEDNLSKHIDVREELLKQKDAQISGLQAKIQEKSEEFANELKMEKEKMAKLEAESNERELDLERRASGLARLEIELESKQLKFEANQEIERKRILEEKRKIQDQRQLIETERRNFQRIILEESEHMATAKATAFIHQNLAKPQPSQNPGMATSKRPQRTLDSLMGQHLSEDPLPNTGSDLSEMDLRGMINALEGERAKNQDQRSKIQEHKKMLKEEWKRIKDERKTILEAVKKLGEAEKRFAQKLNEIEDITQSCVELRQESRRCLEMAQQLGDQRSESKRALHHQLEQIQRKEAQL